MRRWSTIACVAAGGLALAGCASHEKYEESQRMNAELDHEYQQLSQKMSSEIDANNMQITRLQNTIRLSINSDLVFPSGEWDMSDSALGSIAKVAAIVGPNQQTEVVVDGYTDNEPVARILMKRGVTSNLMLTQKQANTVMQYMIAHGVKPGLISARGFGDAGPVASNSTPEGRAKNRRVELHLASAGH
jgi:chemotaxis protein MotB